MHLHPVVDKKVEAVEVEVADARFQSVLDGEEAIQHDVLHASLYSITYIVGTGFVFDCIDSTIVRLPFDCSSTAIRSRYDHSMTYVMTAGLFLWVIALRTT